MTALETQVPVLCQTIQDKLNTIRTILTQSSSTLDRPKQLEGVTRHLNQYLHLLHFVVKGREEKQPSQEWEKILHLVDNTCQDIEKKEKLQEDKQQQQHQQQTESNGKQKMYQDCPQMVLKWLRDDCERDCDSFSLEDVPFVLNVFSDEHDKFLVLSLLLRCILVPPPYSSDQYHGDSIRQILRCFNKSNHLLQMKILEGLCATQLSLFRWQSFVAALSWFESSFRPHAMQLIFNALNQQKIQWRLDVSYWRSILELVPVSFRVTALELLSRSSQGRVTLGDISELVMLFPRRVDVLHVLYVIHHAKQLDHEGHEYALFSWVKSVCFLSRILLVFMPGADKKAQRRCFMDQFENRKRDQNKRRLKAFYRDLNLTSKRHKRSRCVEK